ncbi:MAG: ABC transporter ATP-binding protein [Bdellovibrionota bacterium]|nr:MAG: ABC transporter ATP-binding protein [Bdellovibrionota bacterium]
MNNSITELILSLDQVSKEYDAGRSIVRALDRVSLELRQGELLGIAGPSGSGKSTLLSIMGLVIRPSSGRMIFAGRDLTHGSDGVLRDMRRKEIGFIFQYFHLLPTLTAEENVSLSLLLNGVSLHEANERARLALSQVGLLERASHYPTQLSGGELQRVAICRATVHRPQVILADEPTGNLDTARGHEIVDLLDSLRRSYPCGIAMVSHNEEMLERCDRIVHLRDGKIG